jgi:hypothetical protein
LQLEDKLLEGQRIGFGWLHENKSDLTADLLQHPRRHQFFLDVPL